MASSSPCASRPQYGLRCCPVNNDSPPTLPICQWAAWPCRTSSALRSRNRGEIIQGCCHGATSAPLRTTGDHPAADAANNRSCHDGAKPGQSCRVSGLPAGNYGDGVRAVALTGAHSRSLSVSFTIEVPAIPRRVEGWGQATGPQHSAQWCSPVTSPYGTLCNGGGAKCSCPGRVQTKATNAGLGAYMTFRVAARHHLLRVVCGPSTPTAKIWSVCDQRENLLRRRLHFSTSRMGRSV